MTFTLYNISLNLLDIAALIWFVAGWVGFSYYADYSRKNTTSLVGIAYHHYLHWMNHMAARTDRLIDSRIIEALLNNARFFASTAILILAGLVTMLGYAEKGEAILSKLPFVLVSSPFMWEIKTLLLIIIFIYAFYKCTWSIRQYSYVCMLMGAAPDAVIEFPKKEYAAHCAELVSNSARHFNMGMRGYYFGLAVLSWFIHPVLFMVVDTWVLLVLYRREFHSRVLHILSSLHHV